MNRRPFFSVIVPTHKRAPLLRRALTSIKAQGPQNMCEVIVVSDATDVDTDHVCAELLGDNDAYLRRGGPPGPSQSRNLALSQARGTYVLFLDDDDAWHPHLLENLRAQAPVQQGNPVYFDCTTISERRPPGGPQQLAEMNLNLLGRLTDEVYVKNQVHMSCYAFPRQVLEGVSFDPFMRAYEDWDFLLSVFDRQMPEHVAILGSRVFEVPDETTDRRGSSPKANDFNAVLDYLYVYHRHPAPRPELRQMRARLLQTCGVSVPPDML